MMSKRVPSAVGKLQHVCNKTARILRLIPLDRTTSGKHFLQNGAGPGGSSVLLGVTRLCRAGPGDRLRLQSVLILSSRSPQA